MSNHVRDSPGIFLYHHKKQMCLSILTEIKIIQVTKQKCKPLLYNYISIWLSVNTFKYIYDPVRGAYLKIIEKNPKTMISMKDIGRQCAD